MNSLPNKDQVEGKAKQVQGRVENAAGALADDNETRAAGVGKEVEGKVQEAYGNVKKAIHDATR